MKKTCFYTELAYILGLVIIAVSAAMMEKSDLGVSMVVAPAYLIYLKLSSVLPFFTFGMAEYSLQGVLLILMVMLLRHFQISYLFSFVTAVLYGLVLDGAMLLLAPLDTSLLIVRIALFLVGMLSCACGVSLMFHTYVSPEVYELLVKELSGKFGIEIHKFKTIYDCLSCVVGVILSFAFFGLWHFEGVKWGTIFCALVNGKIISLFSSMFEKRFEFVDRFKLRPFFETTKTRT